MATEGLATGTAATGDARGPVGPWEKGLGTGGRLGKLLVAPTGDGGKS